MACFWTLTGPDDRRGPVSMHAAQHEMHVQHRRRVLVHITACASLRPVLLQSYTHELIIEWPSCTLLMVQVQLGPQTGLVMSAAGTVGTGAGSSRI